LVSQGSAEGSDVNKDVLNKLKTKVVHTSPHCRSQYPNETFPQLIT